jgi:hypothetical protein
MYKKLKYFGAGLALFGGLMAPNSTVFAEEQVEVFMMGDSMMKSVGRAMKKVLKAEGVTADYYASIGSGLARLDLFDWSAQTDDILLSKPSKVVIFIGANDNQPMDAPTGNVAFGTDAWAAEYGKRCNTIMSKLIENGVKQVIWVGLPCMRDSKLDADVKKINEVVLAAANTHPEVSFEPTYDMFSKKGAYSAYIIQSTGIPLDVRESDGTHLNRQGAEMLAKTLVAKLK